VAALARSGWTLAASLARSGWTLAASLVRSGWTLAACAAATQARTSHTARRRRMAAL
jgi:hypothetical protein